MFMIFLIIYFDEGLSNLRSSKNNNKESDNESATRFSQFTSLKIKKNLRKPQSQFWESSENRGLGKMAVFV